MVRAHSNKAIEREMGDFFTFFLLGAFDEMDGGRDNAPIY